MRSVCMVVLNVFLLLLEVNGQKKVKEVKYPVDGNIQKLDFHVTGFPTDTIDVLCLETGDLLKLNLIGYDAAGKSVSLVERGYKIKSFKMTSYLGHHALDYPQNGDVFDARMMWSIYTKDHFYISDLIVVDAKGKKSKLPLLKTFSVKGNCVSGFV